jgi:hypothetical protein
MMKLNWISGMAKKRINGLLDEWMNESIHPPGASVHQSINPTTHQSAAPFLR